MKPTKLNSEQLIAFALAHHRAGRLAEAEGIYRQIISTEPRNARALDLLGVLTLQSGRLEPAAAYLNRAVAAEPSHGNYRCNLGFVLRRLGKSDEAIAEFREAVRLTPDLAVAHNNLGIALTEKLQFDEAIAAYQRAIELEPAYADAHGNLANALRDAGRIDEALASCHRAIELKPDVATGYNNLGVILASVGRFAEAQGAYRRAIDLQASYGDAWSNLGNALATQGEHDAALAASRRAIEIEPDALQSHWNYAVILLRSGDLAAGFREYEWRWKQQKHFPRPSPRYYPPRFPTPHWTGGDIAGQTILLHAEQGFGDTLHFCRYAPLVAARGARVIMEVHPELCRLLKSLNAFPPSPGTPGEGWGEGLPRHKQKHPHPNPLPEYRLTGPELVFPRGESLPPFDQHCPLMSLPLAFNTTLETTPSQVPYLWPDDADVMRWKAIVESGGTAIPTGEFEIPSPHAQSTKSHVGRALPAIDGRGGQCPPYVEPSRSTSVDAGRNIPNIGLCWAGSPDHADDRDRSLLLSQLAPFASAAVRFHSLQNEGPAAEQAGNPPPGMQLIDYSVRLGDFGETAALIANLDLVITADTAVAHLAGAMGRPVWVFLRYLSDWRWLIGRSDTPWYPTMRLFRQETRGEWKPVVERVARELRQFFETP